MLAIMTIEIATLQVDEFMNEASVPFRYHDQRGTALKVRNDVAVNLDGLVTHYTFRTAFRHIKYHEYTCVILEYDDPIPNYQPMRDEDE